MATTNKVTRKKTLTVQLDLYDDGSIDNTITDYAANGSVSAMYAADTLPIGTVHNYFAGAIIKALDTAEYKGKLTRTQ